jgi:hypothetical protein
MNFGKKKKTEKRKKKKCQQCLYVGVALDCLQCKSAICLKLDEE